MASLIQRLSRPALVLFALLGFSSAASAVPDRALHGFVDVTLAGSGSGRVTSQPEGIDCPDDCTDDYFSVNDPRGYEPVVLTATANPGSVFEGWGGQCSGTSTCTVDPVEQSVRYPVTATFTLVPDLVETSISVSKRKLAAGKSLRVRDTVQNSGLAAAAPSAVGYYLSRDPVYGAGDRRLGRRAVSALDVGTTASGGSTVGIPKSTARRSYRIIGCVDYRGQVLEADEGNNCRATTVLKVTR